MSISDMIVVMKAGVVHQIGKPQDVYDRPANLFVAKFLGTPAINVFRGRVSGGRLFIGEDEVLSVSGVDDKEVWVGIRPEGFILSEDGALRCGLEAVEVMGRDTSVVAVHPAAESENIRAIISAENTVDTASGTVRFTVKPHKLFIFDIETEENIPFN